MTDILTASLELFDENGYHGTTVRQIANRVGVTVPALYYHHANKEAVLVALFEISMSELNTRTEAAEAEAGENPARRFALVVGGDCSLYDPPVAACCVGHRDPACLTGKSKSVRRQS